MICFVTLDNVCVGGVTITIQWLTRKKSSLQCISRFLCLHVKRRNPGFWTLQTSVKSNSPEKLFITSNDLLCVLC